MKKLTAVLITLLVVIVCQNRAMALPDGSYTYHARDSGLEATLSLSANTITLTDLSGWEPWTSEFLGATASWVYENNFYRSAPSSPNIYFESWLSNKYASWTLQVDLSMRIQDSDDVWQYSSHGSLSPEGGAPEPATMVGMGLALVAIGWRRFRKSGK